MSVVVCEGSSEDVHGEAGHGEGVIWRVRFAGLSWVVVWLALRLPFLCIYRCHTVLHGSWLCRPLHRLVMVAFDSSSLFGSAMKFHLRSLASPPGRVLGSAMKYHLGPPASSPGFIFHDLLMGAISCSSYLGRGLFIFYLVSLRSSLMALSASDSDLILFEAVGASMPHATAC
ncbi:hypothetical protein Dimus_015219 [Dionaea muscipula]